jgi:hypothetical protein
VTLPDVMRPCPITSKSDGRRCTKSRNHHADHSWEISAWHCRHVNAHGEPCGQRAIPLYGFHAHYCSLVCAAADAILKREGRARGDL